MKRTPKNRRSVYKAKKVLKLVKDVKPTYLPRSIQKSMVTLELAYSGKKSKVEILAQEPNITLHEVSSYGQMGLDKHHNRLIEGDNLEVLRYLLNDKSVTGKVREIYIDPPYSTNQEFRLGSERTSTISASDSDEVAYVDSLSGSAFLEFLRERLILLREILSDDGSIYLHIDYKIGHYVKVVMDEIFGARNFINDITRIKCNPKNFSRRGYGNIKDLILFYSKSKNFLWNEPRVEMTEEDIERLFPKIDKSGRRYTTTPLHAPGETKNGLTGKSWQGLFPPSGRHWRVPPKVLSKLERENLIEWSKNGNPRKRIFADEVLSRGKKLQDIWELKDPPYPSYPTEKNLELLKRIIRASSEPGDIVLDCFAGSGTTLVAAEELKRHWIGIDSSKAAIKTTIKRLQTVKNTSAFVQYQAVPIKNDSRKYGTYL